MDFIDDKHHDKNRIPLTEGRALIADTIIDMYKPKFLSHAEITAAMVKAVGYRSNHGAFYKDIEIYMYLAEHGFDYDLRTERMTEKMYVLCSEYVKDYDKTKALKRAGYDTTKSSRVEEIFAKPCIQAEIDRRQRKIAKKLQIDANDIILEFANIGFADIGDFVDVKDGNVDIKDFEGLDTRAVAEVKMTSRGPQIKLHSKSTALENLAKFFGMYKERLEVTGKDGKDIELAAPIDKILGKLSEMAPKAAAEESKQEKEDSEESEES